MPITVKTLQALNLGAFLCYKVSKSGQFCRPSRVKKLQVIRAMLPSRIMISFILAPDGNIEVIHPLREIKPLIKNDIELLKILFEYNYPEANTTLRKKLLDIAIKDLDNAYNC